LGRYLRKAEPEQLRSARLVIVGRGKDALDLSGNLRNALAKRVLEGTA